MKSIDGELILTYDCCEPTQVNALGIPYRTTAGNFDHPSCRIHDVVCPYCNQKIKVRIYDNS